MRRCEIVDVCLGIVDVSAPYGFFLPDDVVRKARRRQQNMTND
ncbi:MULTISPECIES: hypothetical protein [unclassified Microcoleus]